MTASSPPSAIHFLAHVLSVKTSKAKGIPEYSEHVVAKAALVFSLQLATMKILR